MLAAADEEGLEAVHERIGRDRLHGELVGGRSEALRDLHRLAEHQEDGNVPLGSDGLVERRRDVGAQIAIDDRKIEGAGRSRPVDRADRGESGALERFEKVIGVAFDGEQNRGSLHCPSFTGGVCLVTVCTSLVTQRAVSNGTRTRGSYPKSTGQLPRSIRMPHFGQ